MTFEMLSQSEQEIVKHMQAGAVLTERYRIVDGEGLASHEHTLTLGEQVWPVTAEDFMRFYCNDWIDQTGSERVEELSGTHAQTCVLTYRLLFS